MAAVLHMNAIQSLQTWTTEKTEKHLVHCGGAFYDEGVVTSGSVAYADGFVSGCLRPNDPLMLFTG